MSLVTVQTEIPPRCLRAPQAAAYLGLSIHTLNGLRSAGNGPAFIREGRAVLYDIRDLDAWIDRRQRFRSTSEAK